MLRLVRFRTYSGRIGQGRASQQRRSAGSFRASLLGPFVVRIACLCDCVSVVGKFARKACGWKDVLCFHSSTTSHPRDCHSGEWRKSAWRYVAFPRRVSSSLSYSLSLSLSARLPSAESVSQSRTAVDARVVSCAWKSFASRACQKNEASQLEWIKFVASFFESRRAFDFFAFNLSFLMIHVVIRIQL